MTSPLLRLRILHTNDIHSHFEQMPSIAAAFHELRASAGAEHTLTLDIGDHMDRMRPQTEGSSGSANLAVMNETGYEAVALGNNEGLTFTKEALNDIYSSKANFKVLCSNLLDSETGKVPSWGVPYHIVEKGGIRIGLIGVTAYFTDFYTLLGWDIQEPIRATANLVRELRAQVDLIVVLSHLGLRNDEKMAAEIPEIDIILGGHTHHLLEIPQRIGNTVVCAAGKFGQYFGVVDVHIDAFTRKPVTIEGYVRRTDDYAESGDDQVKAVIERYEASSNQVLSREVAYLQQPLAAEWYKEAPLGNLLAEGLRKRVGVDIGIVNAGQFLEGLANGPVTVGRLLEICPSPINPCLMLLSGENILQALEESLLPEFQEKLLYGFGFRGKVLGMLNVDGLRIEYDLNAPAYAKIKRVWIGSELLAVEKEYQVATIDMFTFGVGYHSLSKGRGVQYFLPEFLRDIMRTELQDSEAIQQSNVQRWFGV
ncbi:bifunctional metallophosphatase/5'-nucleotidase [Paenibacillus radicis (ex Xue et al. 2023)]|uniref:Bifunctional metallophosphatase/5'-nucleotidase n=1 Tax=Paenibacillus radicis (ex Xue et al. 2023) TaxID=2972489 RepID=A0ABT1YPF6_9BACL|nr:bifunctional UDP-sugar hydrolase/5'-nucleotidase [Paenibacillus radicis (ex Xue et al. 2023)]MCR8634610.1 bifunctional metallophosphatase/5'-nucleotidase [Paenibacillus radicis (ex Xue et al. 2023)]